MALSFCHCQKPTKFACLTIGVTEAYSMPTLITTQTRIAYLGKPRIIIIGDRPGELEVAKGPPAFIGFLNKVFIFINWFFLYFSFDKSNRLIIARPKDGVH